MHRYATDSDPVGRDFYTDHPVLSAVLSSISLMLLVFSLRYHKKVGEGHIPSLRFPRLDHGRE